MEDRIIFHVDVNSAFLSWEAVYRIEVLGETLDLRTIPSAVGGDLATRHGIILAKSTPAKKYKIQTGEPIVKALQKCPELVIVPPNHSLYEQCSRNLLKLLHEYTPVIEPFSIDEAYLDMTGALGGFESPVHMARAIKDRIKNELGFTVNIGISSNKLLAKMASDFEKPDMVHTLFPDEIPLKMWPLPLEALYFVGKTTSKILHGLGLNTIGDIANTDVSILKAHLGNKHGQLIHQYARGIDHAAVETEEGPNKGYSNSTTLSQDVTDFETAKTILLTLSETVAARLRTDKVKCSCIAVELTDCDFNHQTHQTTLLSPTNTANTIYEAACRLLKECWDGTPLRLLGIRATKLGEEEYTQLNLFDMGKSVKLEKLDKAIDNIRSRFGSDAIKRARFLESGSKPKNTKLT
ncbi:MAG: DNA polymerase IV [Lachnoclostridium sp.]